MEQICMPKILYTQPEGIIKVGRLRARCRDKTRKEARMLGISWWAAAMSREEWRKLLQKAKTLSEL
jgi:hypothetical protein